MTMAVTMSSNAWRFGLQLVAAVHALLGVSGVKGSAPTLPGYQRLEGAMLPRQCQVGVLIQPSRQQEVAEKILSASAACQATGPRAKLSIRASRQLYHGSSDLLCPASAQVPPACSVLMDMQNMNQVLGLDSTRQAVTTGPSILLDSLLNWLAPHGLTLDFQNLPFYSNLTVAGMLLTGAHGSSRTKPSVFGELVSEVTWVAADGSVHTTTDVSPFIGSNGMIGIITELKIQVQPLTKLKALPRRMHDRQLQQQLQSILSDPHLALIQWLPDVKQAIVMTREAVPVTTPGNAEFQVLDSHPLIAAGSVPALGLNQIDNGLLGNRLLLDDLPLCLAELLLLPYHRDEITRLPIPFGVPAVGHTAVMASSNCIPGPDFGCLWRNLVTNLVEVDLDVAQLPGWMDDVRRIVRNSVPTCLPSVIGFAMRFGGASQHPADMAWGRDTVYVDIVSNKAPWLVDAGSSYQHVFDEIEQLSFCKYGARPHWGKNSNRNFANSRCPPVAQYPCIEQMLSRARQHDPEGVFVSPLLQHVLNRQSLPKTPGCGVRAECYCDDDVDCGPSFACVPADTFPEFKVCKSRVLSVKNDLVLRVRQALEG